MKQTDLTIENKTYKNIFVAETFYERFKGLMFVKKENAFSLLIKNCNSVHTCFMKFNLDIFCLDKDYRVVKIYKNVKPFRCILPVANCSHILEMKSHI